MLRLKNINTYYGKVHALKNVSLHLGEGEIVTLIGANGAGKTTILNTISGVTPAAGGDVLFCKEPVTGLSPDRIVKLGHIAGAGGAPGVQAAFRGGQSGTGRLSALSEP